MTRILQLTSKTLLPRTGAAGHALLDPWVTAMRVRPSDLDMYGHVNNAKYLQMGDIARWEYVTALDGFTDMRAHRWYPVVAASTMKYKRSLKLLDRFEITTHTLGWDDRVIYMEQTFVKNDQLHAQSLAALRFLGPENARIPTPTVIQTLDTDAPARSPDLSEELMAWARWVDVAHRPAPDDTVPA